MEVDSDVLPSGSSDSPQQTAAVAGPSSASVKVLPQGGVLSSVLASAATIPSVTVSLHPLVIMNMSEHWTRIRAQEGSKQQGKQSEMTA